MQRHLSSIHKYSLTLLILTSTFILPSCDITSMLACRVLDCERGTCELDGEEAVCICEPGWSGERCDLEEGGLCAPGAAECDLPPECDGLDDPECGPDDPPYPPGPDFINKPWGSYKAGIKADPESPSFPSGEAISYDIDLTLNALLQTGQNFYGISANDEFHYRTLQHLLAHPDSSNMQIFAVLGERHLSPTNRWLDTEDYHLEDACPTVEDCKNDCDNAKTTCDAACDTTIPECAEECETTWSACHTVCETCYEGWDEETHDRFLAAWKKAAKELSQLSLTYPQLEGFTIDDFNGWVCGPKFGKPSTEDSEADTKAADGCFTEADIGKIRDAGRCGDECNNEFKFWPTVYFQSGIPKLFSQAHVLGQRARSEGNMNEGEEISMNITFALDEVPTNFMLSFLYNDGYNDTQNDASVDRAFQGKLFKFVRVNDSDNLLPPGSEPGQDDVWDSQWVEYFSQNISEHLDSHADNHIFIGLQAADDGDPDPESSALADANALRFMYEKILYVWDIQMRKDEIDLDDDDYTISYSVPSETSRHFFAEQASMNLADDVDGVLAPTRAPTRIYDDPRYRQILQRTRPYIGDGDFITVSYGWLYDKEIESHKRVEEIQTSLEYADRVLVWNLPMHMHYHQEERGIFFERSAGDNYELFSTWPSHQGCMEGWYQKWTTTISTEDAPAFSFAVYQHPMDVLWTDETKRDVAGEFFHSTLVHLESGDTLFDSNDEDDKLFMATDYTDTREYTVGAGYSSSTFVFRVENRDSCGNINHLLKLRLRTADGSPVEGWTYTTGTIIDEIPEVYCEVTQAMMEETGRPSPPFSETWANECLEADASPE
ncbi:MAG: hypothetical protein QGI45_17430 [Myxococcota bacterium]|nr:hypothetical protein [Myxococcota bacterium]